MEEIKKGEKKENLVQADKTEKIANIEKKDAVKGTDSFNIKKAHIIIGVLLLIIVIGVVIGSLMYSKNKGGLGMNNELAAEVNGQKITMESLNKEYEKIPAQQRPSVKRMDLLNQTIVTTILLQEAKKEKITISDDEVEKVISEVKLPPGQTMESILQLQGYTLDEFKLRLKDQLVIQKLLNETVTVNVSDEEIKEFFDKNKDAFKQQLSVNASHILVNSSIEADEIVKELKKGVNFEELAKEKSLDTGTKESGGNLGVFPKGAMVKEFEDAAFSLKVGEISNPIKTQFGYHIIKVNEKFEEKDATLEDSKDKVEEAVRRQKLNEAALDYIRNLYTSAKIKIYLKEE